MNTDADLIPGSFNPRFAAVFAWYTRRLLRSSFHALRLSRGTPECLASAGATSSPLLLLLTHSSWWDPLVGLWLSRRFMPARSSIAPMDSAMLRKFGFFKRLGLFGINPDNPDSLVAMQRYALDHFQRTPSPSLWITPQGNFADPRAPLVIRPGAAAIAARSHAPALVAVAIEYGFWLDQRPEVFIRAQHVAPPSRTNSTPRWHAAISQTMQQTRDALAADVSCRNPDAFSLEGGRAAAINPIYDLWLRLKGSTSDIETRQSGRGGVSTRSANT